jgi:hypothetical protein
MKLIRKGETLALRSWDEWRRIYNVAASRARDQLWGRLFH